LKKKNIIYGNAKNIYIFLSYPLLPFPKEVFQRTTYMKIIRIEKKSTNTVFYLAQLRFQVFSISIPCIITTFRPMYFSMCASEGLGKGFAITEED